MPDQPLHTIHYVNPPDDVEQYLSRLVERLTSSLCDDLIGVYVLGGLALGDYRRASSDLDVYVVVRNSLDEDEKLALAAACSHSALRCPARQLEMVVISAEEARQPTAAPRWELNLNTGPGRTDHVGLDVAAEPSHWFVLDLAIAHERGVALLGPAAPEVVGMPLAADVKAAQSEAVSWYARNDMPAETVAAACRAWHWLATGAFAAKRPAVRWALARLDHPPPNGGPGQ
jgi:hypothetical protein